MFFCLFLLGVELARLTEKQVRDMLPDNLNFLKTQAITNDRGPLHIYCSECVCHKNASSASVCLQQTQKSG